MNLYCAVILRPSDQAIFSTWACYADNIKDAKAAFEDTVGHIYENFVVYFKLVKEG